jgi:hypothetical protein
MAEGVLTLTGTIPGEPGVGGVILNDLYKGLPPGTLHIIPAVSSRAIELSWLEDVTKLAGYVPRRYETGWNPIRGSVGDGVAWTARKVLFEKHCRNLVSEICNHPAAQSCNRVWAVLDCPTIIQIAKPVAEKLDKPLSVLVWDAPELLVKQFQMDRWSAANMLARFSNTIQHSDRVGVICEQMRTAYLDKFGPNDYIVSRHGIDETMWHSPHSGPTSDQLVIGFAGSITAREPFDQLVKTLDNNRWRINGKNVILRLIGSRYTLESRHLQHIEYFGWRILSDAVRLLAECDMLYLPQPFEADLRMLAELSFPTKLTTYMAAGRRVLLHAPGYASITSFLADHPVGIQCDSLKVKNIHHSLEQLDREPASNFAEAIDAARRAEFSKTVFLNRFKRLLGIDVSISASADAQGSCVE